VRQGSTRTLICSFTDCDYKRPFRRSWELQRHVAAKHTNEKPFSCPVVDCVRGDKAIAFVRPDKVTAHIRAAHRDKTTKAVCPVASCANTPLELELLGLHIKLHHLSDKQQGDEVTKTLRAITNAASIDHRQCLLQSCKKRVDLEDFHSHLASHTSEDLNAISSELAREGYIVSNFHCEHGATDGEPINEWCLCRINLVEAACPVCRSRHWDRQSLRAHIEQAHVWTGENMTPFRQRILALIGMEATQVLGTEVWSDVACQLTQDIQR